MKRVCANCRFVRIDIRGEEPCFVCVKNASVVTNICERKNCYDLWELRFLSVVGERMESDIE